MASRAAADASVLGELVYALIHELKPDTPITVADFIQRATQALAHPAYAAYLMLQDQDIVGFISLNECCSTYAGGAFGEVIKALDLGKVFGDTLAASGLGLAIPFTLAAIFKTAQGSSTVAVISTASIIAPLLASIGLDTEGGHLLALMAAGAGSMFFSHTNDSYFWVISKFSKLDVATTLRAHSMASALMAVVAFLSVWLASFII